MSLQRPSLSVIIPCYNEVGTLALILRKIAATLPKVSKELVIIDDCSTDGSRDLLAAMGAMPVDEWREFLALDQASDIILPSLKPVFHETNGGKGTAIRSGLSAATGDVIIIQDADLEYEPADWVEMYELIEQDKADVVYGSRFYGRPHRSLYYHHYFGNRLISRLFNLLYNQILTDIETCYKMFRRDVVEGIEFVSADFGIEVELSAAIVLARRWRIYEMGIRYFGRTFDEGKKINWRDGVKALGYLIRFRFRSYQPQPVIRERRQAYLAGAATADQTSGRAADNRDQRGAEKERVDHVD